MSVLSFDTTKDYEIKFATLKILKNIKTDASNRYLCYINNYVILLHDVENGKEEALIELHRHLIKKGYSNYEIHEHYGNPEIEGILF